MYISGGTDVKKYSLLNHSYQMYERSYKDFCVVTYLHYTWVSSRELHRIESCRKRNEGPMCRRRV